MTRIRKRTKSEKKKETGHTRNGDIALAAAMEGRQGDVVWKRMKGPGNEDESEGKYC